jgi:hypothetical protein
VTDDANSFWWLSFADDDGFRGVVIVEASSFMDAVMMTHVFGINPGGEARGWEVPERELHKIPEHHVGRLLSIEELRAHKPYDVVTVSEMERQDRELMN